MDEYRIKIPEGLNYKIVLKDRLVDTIYYPAFLDLKISKNKIYLREGPVGIDYFIEAGENTLAMRGGTINTKHLNHLDFSNIDDNLPRVFIHEGLAKILGSSGFDYFSSDLIICASKIKDYKKYFEMFAWGLKTSKKFKNSNGEFFKEFDKEEPKDYFADKRYENFFKRTD